MPSMASTSTHPPGPHLGVATWPAYVTAGVTAVYGLLKTYWVLGGTALWDIAPLPAWLIEQARTHTAPTWFVVIDAATVFAAAAGVVLAIATIRLPRWIPPARLLRYPLGFLSALMVLRATVAGLGDAYALMTGAYTRTAVWDLALWSPFFLVWGLLWAATAVTYSRRSHAASAAQ